MLIVDKGFIRNYVSMNLRIEVFSKEKFLDNFDPFLEKELLKIV